MRRIRLPVVAEGQGRRFPRRRIACRRRCLRKRCGCRRGFAGQDSLFRLSSWTWTIESWVYCVVGSEHLQRDGSLNALSVSLVIQASIVAHLFSFEALLGGAIGAD